MKINKQFALAGVSALLSTAIFAADYPFQLPNSFTATINVNTSRVENYNNLLLGTNQNSFTSNSEKAFIADFDPITIRFPHGLWANWYDWRSDSTRLFGTETFRYDHANGRTLTKTVDHLTQIRIFENSNHKIGIDGVTQLHSEKKAQNGKGYDLLWTFNMNADAENGASGSTETIARYQDLKDRGLPVKAIELGNENFYPGQRSSIIPNTEDYIARAKKMSAALKRLDPNVKLSVPLLRRENSANPNWNRDVTEDSSYFDAVSVHTYVGYNPDDDNSGEGAFATALTARHHLAKSIDDYAGQVAPNKPVWLTEWGVRSGGPNAVSVLGMADAYIFMSQNQNRYERANWFTVNGKLNSFLVWEEYRSPSGVMRPRIKQPLQKTAIGSSYEIIRGAFENSKMYGSWMSSPDLINGVESVSARALVKNGKTTIFVVNLTNKAVPFDVKLDGVEYNGRVLHRTMSFNHMTEERNTAWDQDPMETVRNGAGQVTLPKFSMSTIELKDADDHQNIFRINMTAPADNRQVTLGNAVTLKADAVSSNNDIRQVNFLVNGSFVKQDNNAPYSISWTPTRAGTYSVHAIAIKNDGTRLPATSRTVNVTTSGNSGGNTNQCHNYWGSDKKEIDLTQVNCVNIAKGLAGNTLSVWDSETNNSCDFRGTVSSENGTGSLSVTSNYASTESMTGTQIKFTGNCKFVQIRVY